MGKALKKYDASLTTVQRGLAVLRDGHTCQWSRVKANPERMHMSHVYGKGAHPELKHEVDNVLMMTPEAHLEGWHADWETSIAWFEKNFPKRFARLKKKRAEARGARSIPEEFYGEQLKAMESKLLELTAAIEAALREAKA